MILKCQHVHRLELHMFFYFYVVRLPVKREIMRLMSDMHVQNKKYENNRLMGLQGTLATLPQQPKI